MTPSMKPLAMCGTAQMRIVLDTNILVRANAEGRGPARELLQLIVASPGHVLLLSPFLLQELGRVFSYERVRVSSRVTDEEVTEYRSDMMQTRASRVLAAFVFQCISWGGRSTTDSYANPPLTLPGTARQSAGVLQR